MQPRLPFCTSWGNVFLHLVTVHLPSHSAEHKPVHFSVEKWPRLIHIFASSLVLSHFPFRAMSFLPDSCLYKSCYICDFLIFVFQQVGLSLLKKHKTSASLLCPEDSCWGTKNSQGKSCSSDFPRAECRWRLIWGSWDFWASGKLLGQEESCQTGSQGTGCLDWIESLI